MKKAYKLLILVFFILVIVKTILYYFIPAPSSFSDGYLYAKMARSFLVDGVFSVHGNQAVQYPPLYPIVISISYIFGNMQIVYFFMKFYHSNIFFSS